MSIENGHDFPVSSWLKLIAPTCKTYQHLLKPNAHLFNQLWGPSDLPRQEVSVLCYEPLEVDLPGNFLEVLLPDKDPGRLGWGGPIATYLRTIQEPYTCIIWEDVMMTKPFDTSFLNKKTYDYLYENEVAKLSLVHDSSYNHYYSHLKPFKPCNGMPMHRVDKQAKYQLSVVHAIWETQFLIDLCDQYVHPWAIEKGDNTDRVVLVPRRKFTDVVTAVRHQPGYGPDRFQQKFVPKHTLKELKAHDMLERWGIK